MRIVRVLLTLLVALTLPAAPVLAADVTDTTPLTAFHKVRVDGMAEVTLRRGEKESVAVTVPVRQRDHVRVQVVDGELRIRAETHRNWWSSWSSPKTPRIAIVYREIDTVQLAGAVKLRALELRARTLTLVASGASTMDIVDIASDRLRVDGAGAVKARLAGRVATQDVTISGAGKYDASLLVSDDADVEVSGAGKVAVHADRKLRLNLSGAASVRYRGNPEVTRHVTGAASIHHS